MKTLLCIKWPLAPPRGKAIVLCLPSCGFSCSPIQRGSFFNFRLDLSTTRVITVKMHSQSPILKTKGVVSNPVILIYLWEQSCILHSLTKLPACNFDSKSVFNALRTWACIIPLEVVGSVSGKVGSHKQVDLPIHRLQH